jgi:hypothetical protein
MPLLKATRARDGDYRVKAIALIEKVLAGALKHFEAEKGRLIGLANLNRVRDYPSHIIAEFRITGPH